MSAMKSQEASSSASPCSYHVFLSFRGEDTRKTFTDHLYTVLDQAGFRTFRDDDGIEKGEDFKSELQKAIQESRISIIVFSKNYASSTWCLEELVMILKRRTFGHVVIPVFYDVDPSEVRKQIGNFKEAFTRHEEKLESETGELAKEKLKEKLGTWRAAHREVADVAGMNLQNQVDGCLMSVDESSTMVMHHSVQEMGREIVRQESPKEPGKRSILWNHKDAFTVLRETTGTSEIEGLKLDICLLKEEANGCTVFGDNRKRRYEDFLGKPLWSNLGGWLKRIGDNICTPSGHGISELQ